jgi:hypothetical protein
MKKPIVGDKMRTWFSNQEDGNSTVLAVREYDGLYSQWFKWIVTLTAPRTRAGKIEMAV